METKDEKVDGAKIAAQILNRMPKINKERLLSNIAKNDPKISEKIEDKLLLLATPQKSLSPISKETAVLSTETTDAELRSLVTNLSQSEKLELLKGLMEREGGVDAETAKKRLLSILEELGVAKPKARIVV